MRPVQRRDRRQRRTEPGVATAEAQGVGDVTPSDTQQMTWTGTIGDRVFVDAGASRFAFTWGNSERDRNRGEPWPGPWTPRWA